MEKTYRRKIVVLPTIFLIVLFSATIILDLPVKELSKPLYGLAAFLSIIGLLGLISDV